MALKRKRQDSSDSGSNRELVAQMGDGACAPALNRAEQPEVALFGARAAGLGPPDFQLEGEAP